MINERKADRISDSQLLLAYRQLEETICNEEKEGTEKGFTSPKERAIYNTMKILFPAEAEDATNTLFDLITGELGMISWDKKESIQHEIQLKIMRYLKTLKLERSEAKEKAKEMLEILKKNKDA